MSEHIHLLMGEPPRGDPSKVLQVLKQKVSRALRATRRKPLRHQMSLPFHEGEARGHPYSAESPLVAQSFLAVHSKDWPWSSWSYYEKGENGLIAIEFAGAERNERADSATYYIRDVIGASNLARNSSPSGGGLNIASGFIPICP